MNFQKITILVTGMFGGKLALLQAIKKCLIAIRITKKIEYVNDFNLCDECCL